MRTFIIASLAFAAATTGSSAAEFGDLAGTYTGKTATGSEVVIVLPKSGSPTYRFKGGPVLVSNAKISGKTITMNVGDQGTGKVFLSASGKSLAYKWQGGQNTASATLTKN
jgi:hypothetical protein